MDSSSYAIIIFFGTTNAYLKNDDDQHQFLEDLVTESMLGFTLVTYPTYIRWAWTLFCGLCRRRRRLQFHNSGAFGS